MSKDKKEKGLEPVSLPYNFIPFPANNTYKYVYKDDSLPKHNVIKDCNGYIDYEIQPHSSIAMDFREIEKGKKYYVSGSAIKGLVRSNLEILSGSYPTFIDRVTLSYRDIAGTEKDNYAKSLFGNDKDKDIGKTIQVGYLKKEGDRYYIQPASKVNGKNFTTIEEHRLVKLGIFGKGNKNLMYKWDDRDLVNKMNDNKEHIEILTSRIEGLKSKVDKSIKEKLDKYFKKHCNFNKLQNNSTPEKLKEKIINDLEDVLNDRYSSLKELVDLYAERLKLKFEIYLKYKKGLRRNFGFIPYSEFVYFNENLSVIKKEAKSEDNLQKGYLYCSTNASSKRRHYIIGEENKEDKKLEVSQVLRNAYNSNMNNFRPPTDKKAGEDNTAVIKKFYDVFNVLEKDKQQVNKNKIIIFYTEKDGEVKSIGRTPYMKVLYKNQIETLIKSNNTSENNIDYARAMFGYSEDDFKYENKEELKTTKNYKSRLRFNPLIFDVSQTPIKEEGFTLLDPKPSACGMYLKQNSNGDKVITYNDDGAELNGYKYYKILEEEIKPQVKDGNYQSSKMVLKENQKTKISGRIYFSNLTRAELGLLIMSLDANEIVNMEEFKEINENINKDIKRDNANVYESIGGAKPYGYGKVRIKINELKVNEVKSNDIDLDYFLNFLDANMVDTTTYKNAVLKELPIEHFRNIHIKEYIRSKKEDTAELNWHDMGNKDNTAYKKDWILKKNTEIKKNTGTQQRVENKSGYRDGSFKNSSKSNEKRQNRGFSSSLPEKERAKLDSLFN